MSQYTNIPMNSKGDAVHLYNYINKTITSETKAKREQLQRCFDDFCTFWWRGVDAFETFGAFIINKKDLKFYNGPGFSNEYTQPQFESSAGQLTGIKFKTQQISFNIGVYWISIEHYRQLIYWLHPYEINTLAFGFDHNHYYQVKLANMTDSTRTIIGKESVPVYDLRAEDTETLMSLISDVNLNKTVYYTVTKKVYLIQQGDAPTGAIVNGNYYAQLTNIEPFRTEPRYYTELKLTFEIQGTPCAYNWEEFNFLPSIEQSGGGNNPITGIIFATDPTDNDAEVGSDLPAPIQANFAVELGLKNENFALSNNMYEIENTEWHLISTITWPDSSITISRRFSSNNNNYNTLTIDRVNKKIYYDSTEVYNDNDGWTPTSEDSTDYGEDSSYSSLYRIIYFPEDVAAVSGSSLVDFLINNSQIEYYTNMKVNLILSVGMHGDPNADIPSADLSEKTLFDLTLKNLTWGNSIEELTNIFDLGYDSESGLLYMTSADSQYFLLNTLSTSAKGQRIVDSMVVNSFAITGLFEDPAFDIKNLYFVLRLKTYSTEGLPVSDLTITSNDLITGATVYLNHFVSLHFEDSGTYLSLRGRTNLI